jgi:beta-1,4-mannosyl-glycoprotein beta-1,4-N-acetylglucosaminyltransferase
MLVDAFMFYNEFDILELRLEVLDRYVDRFVLVEAEVNHVGGPKELFFQNNKERYAKWLHKIEHVIVTAEEAPKDENPWAREKYQRECILRGLDGVPDEAIVMVSDVDEIPNLDVVPFEKLEHVFTSVHMWMFEYSLDYLFTGEPWFGTVITNVGILRRVGPNKLRDGRWKFPCVQYAGWHLSSFGTPMHVWNKMQTFAHAKDGHHATQTPEMFKQWIEEGVHTDGKTSLMRRPDVVPLPAPAEVLRRLKLGTFP